MKKRIYPEIKVIIESSDRQSKAKDYILNSMNEACMKYNLNYYEFFGILHAIMGEYQYTLNSMMDNE